MPTSQQQQQALSDLPSPLALTASERLTRAASQASEERDLQIDAGVIEAALSGGEVRVLFQDVDGEASRQIAALSSADVKDYPLLDTSAAILNAGSLTALIETTGTQRIELDRLHRPTLVDSIPLIEADVLHASEDDGDGFAVAILDTGVDSSHPAFAGRIVEEACFSTEGDCPNENSSMFGPGAATPCAIGGCGHGTQVAGIAAGADSNDLITGAAPNASIIAIQIFSDVGGEPGAYSSDILAGLQHVLALSDAYTIASVNFSFGSGGYSANCDSSTAMFNAVRRLRDVGIASVAASGNDAWTNAVSSPACLSNVISVGSTNDSDLVSSFSNSSEILTILAPGRSIRSAAVGGGSVFNSGTSMAAPHVAGTIASLREAYPGATVGEIENALTLSGLPVLDIRNGLTFPRIRAAQARALLESATPEPPNPDPTSGLESGGGVEDTAAVASPNGGGGGGCGLVGIEPFLILGAIRAARLFRRRRRFRRQVFESPSV